MKAIFYLILSFIGAFTVSAQVEITPQGTKAADIFLQNTADVSQTGTPALSQLIYNSNSNITGSNANGAGYYFWNGTSWQSLDANVPTGTIVFSENHPNQPLLNAGFAMIGTTQMTTPALDVWRKMSTINAPLSAYSTVAYYFGKFYFFGINSKNRAIYDPDIDTWISIDTTNASIDSPPNHASFMPMKDRVLAVNYYENLVKGWVYNPQSNSWQSLSGFDGINGTLLNWSNNSNYTFVRFATDNTSSSFYYRLFNLQNNTYLIPSMVNAPTDNFSHFSSITLPTKIIFMSTRENQYSYIYDIPLNQWSQIDKTNAPTGYDWNYIQLGVDSTIYFTKRTHRNNNPNDTATIVFKKYSFQQNIWTDAFRPIVKPGAGGGKIAYIGKILDKLYFHIDTDIRVYDTNTNQWRLIENPNETPNGRQYFNIMYLFNNKIFKLGGWRNPRFIYDDGFVYNLTTEKWDYIPSAFSQELRLYNANEFLLTNHLFINDKYLLAYFKQNVGISGVNYSGGIVINQSAIMQLSGPTNQTTQKTLYLYKKN